MQYRCQIAAQVAQDAAGKSYPAYLIPEPKSWEKWRAGMQELKKVPRSEFGVNPDVKPPKAAKTKAGREIDFETIKLKRGGEPITLELSGALLRRLRIDKKNLLIFNLEELGGEEGGKRAKA